MSRHDGSGVDRDQRRQASRARSVALGGVFRVRALDQSCDAALQREDLSDGDLADIYAYLQSIPKPPAVNSIPLLNP